MMSQHPKAEKMLSLLSDFYGDSIIEVYDESHMHHGRPRERTRWPREASGGAARSVNLYFSCVFMGCQRFPRMLYLFYLLRALGGAHVEPKAGIYDSALFYKQVCVPK